MALDQKKLNVIMNEEEFAEILEKAKELSKERILAFCKGILGTDEGEFEKLWKVPIISSYEGDKLINKELTEERKDEVLDRIDSTIEYQLGKSEGVTIPYCFFTDSNTDRELEEIKSDEYSDIIVYSKKSLMTTVRNGFTGDESMTIDEMKEVVIKYVAILITHERCHANAIYRIKGNEPDEEIIICGARGTEETHEFDADDEAITEFVTQMIMRYEEGDDIEDCVLKAIGILRKFPLEGLDDKKVCMLMIFFPEELTRWVMLGAHGNSYENLLEKREKEIFGNHPDMVTVLKKKVCNYFNNMDKSNLTNEQIQKRIEMLELMGIKREKIIGLDEIKDLAESEEAMEKLEGGAKALKELINDKTKQK